MDLAYQPGTADRLALVGRIAEGEAALRRGAAAGSPAASFELAVWHLRGREIGRDLPAARALLRAATNGGHADAALLEVALTANGSGAPHNFAEAKGILATAARTDALAAEHLALVNAMDLTSDGDPTHQPALERIAATLDLRRYPALLTAAECEHLRSAFEHLLRPSSVVHPGTGRQMAHPIRRSDAATIGPTRETLVVAAINRRIAAATGTGVAQGEPLTILRYRPGQEYRSHVDTLPGEVNQRTTTVIVYLNDDYAGGRTRFEAIGVDVDPRAGDAIAFRNVTGDGAPDPTSRHRGLPVEQGTKWIATRWIRETPLDPWGAGGA